MTCPRSFHCLVAPRFEHSTSVVRAEQHNQLCKIWTPPCDGTSRHRCYHYHSSCGWLLDFLSLSLFITLTLFPVHQFIQYIRRSHSLTTHHVIIRDHTMAPGIASSCFSPPAATDRDRQLGSIPPQIP